ncbi:MAG: hypothetical protein KF726_26770 [Anaerolineae bacterium]|nr:hypothetical protein [Anaerolineae bacterium]
MAPWFELMLAINLKEDIPQNVIAILKVLAAPPMSDALNSTPPSNYESIKTPKHHFFLEYGWEWFTFLRTDTYYFPGDSFGKLTYDEQKFYKFTARAMVRSHGSLLASFLHWIAPYSQTQGFVGYTRCDESSYISLIYFENGVVHYKDGDFFGSPKGMRHYTIAEDGSVAEELTEDR